MTNYQRIRDLREDADWTQKEVAEKLYLHLTQYRRYENGDSEVPLYIAVNIARLYQVSLDYIAGLTNDKRGLAESELDAAETKLLSGFRRLDQIGQGRMLERLDFLITQQIHY